MILNVIVFIWAIRLITEPIIRYTYTITQVSNQPIIWRQFSA